MRIEEWLVVRPKVVGRHVAIVAEAEQKSHHASAGEARTVDRGCGLGYVWAMIRKASQRGYQPALPGIKRKTLAYGDRTLLTEFRMRKGSTLPLHAHPAEQTGYLVSGHIRLTIGRRTVDTRPGDSWSVPGGTQHGAAILDDSVAIEVFSPVREDYLPRRRVSGRRLPRA